MMTSFRRTGMLKKASMYIDRRGRRSNGKPCVDMTRLIHTKFEGICSKSMKSGISFPSRSTIFWYLFRGRPTPNAGPTRAGDDVVKWIDLVEGTLNFSSIPFGISRSFSAFACSSFSAILFKPSGPKRSFCCSTLAASSALSFSDNFAEGFPRMETWWASDMYVLMKLRHSSWLQSRSKTSYSRRVPTSSKVDPSFLP